MGSMFLVLVLVGGGLIFAAAIVLSILGIIRWVHRASGLGRLSPLFATAGVATGQSASRQTIKVGAVAYKRCATIGIGPEGLYLRVDSMLFGCPAVQIPWSEITAVSQARLYMRSAVGLTVGRAADVCIIVPASLAPLLNLYVQPVERR